MPSSNLPEVSPLDRLRRLFSGLFLGALLASVLVLVPMAGVRKGLSHLLLNWQETALLASSLLSGALAGFLVVRRRILLSDNLHASTVRIDVLEDAQPGSSVSGSPDSGSDSSLVIKGRRLRFSFTGRTKLLCLFVYLLLYNNLCVLCLSMKLGIFDFAGANSFFRSAGLCLVLTGLYVILKTLKSARTIPYLAESDYYLAAVGTEVDALSDSHPVSPTGEAESSAKRQNIVQSGQGHIPELQRGFLRKHPLCLGWLLFMTGLPLIFHAWFPLLAIPGVYIGLNWFFSRDK